MKVIILAAGRGSRLGSYTQEKPKCMCELFGRTLLERAVETIEKSGISKADIGIVTGYKSECFLIEGVTYFHNSDWEHTNMFVSLTKAEEWLIQEPCIVCYSDIVFSPNAIIKLKECKEAVAITYYTGFLELWQKRMENPMEDLETFKMDAKSYLTEIGKKPLSLEDIKGQYMGLIRFTPDGWNQVKETIKKPLAKPIQKLDMTSLLDGMLSNGYPIYAIGTDDLWLECDTEMDIQVYTKEFANRFEQV